MYIDFYKLTQPAFELRYQTSFWWWSRAVRKCYEIFTHGVHTGGTFQLVSGDSGSGKSALLRKICSDLSEDFFVVQLDGGDIYDFYNEVLSGFGCSKGVGSKVEFVIELNRILKKKVTEGKRVLLVIDDAHKLAQSVFEELRMLLGLEKDGHSLLRLLLAGRRELVDILALPENEILYRKLTNHMELAPITEEESHNYIEYRLQVAGSEEQIFTPEAAALIHKEAKGLLKAINVLCTRVLEAGAAGENRVLSASVVKELLASGWEERLSGDLKRLSEEEKKPRPTRTSAAQTAASVAAAVKAAVGNDEGETEESRMGKKSRVRVSRRKEAEKRKKFLLRVVLAAGVCCALFFLYRYISSLEEAVSITHQPFEEVPVVEGKKGRSISLKKSGASSPQSSLPSSNSIAVHPVEITASHPQGRDVGDKKRKGMGRIVIHPLRVFD